MNVGQRVRTEAGKAGQPPAGGRERILEAAFRLFAESGYSGVSMQRIASEASITKATLYHHFQHKEDLFVEMMRDRFGRSQVELERSVEAGETIREKLVAFATVLYGAERADLSRLFGDFHRHVDAARQQAFWDTYDRPWTYLEATVAEAIRNGELAPGEPKLIAKVCFSAFVGQMQIAKFQADIPSPTPELAVAITEMLLLGLLPR
jgi:AcrR family transcriptional regulator